MHYLQVIFTIAILALACCSKNSEVSKKTDSEQQKDQIREEPTLQSRHTILNGDASATGDETIPIPAKPQWAVPLEDRKAIIAQAKRIAIAISQNDRESLLKLQDIEEITESIWKGMDESHQKRNAKKGFKKSFREKGGLFAQMLGFPASFIRYREVDGLASPLIRSSQDGGLNYLEIKFKKNRNKFLISDRWIQRAKE